jgi:hypothetical protein
MYLERKEDLSIVYWLKDKFSSVDFVNIQDGFPNSELVLPTISSEQKTLTAVDIELGNKKGARDRLYNIDVFAINKAQRDEFAYKIYNELAEGIPVYDYDEGFPPDVVPTKIGCLIPKERRIDFIKVIPELVDKLYYRASIVFIVYNNKL